MVTGSEDGQWAPYWEDNTIRAWAPGAVYSRQQRWQRSGLLWCWNVPWILGPSKLGLWKFRLSISFLFVSHSLSLCLLQLLQMKRLKNEYEHKLQEQEEELDEQAGSIQQLSQVCSSVLFTTSLCPPAGCGTAGQWSLRWPPLGGTASFISTPNI